MNSFDDIESELDPLKTAISKDTGRVRRAESREARREIEARVNSSFRKAKDLLTALERSLRGYGPRQKRGYSQKLEAHKADVKQLRKDFDREKEFAARSDLMEGSGGGGSKQSSEARGRVLEGHDRAKAATSKLDETHALVTETGEIAVAVLSEMGDQGDTLRRAKGKVEDTNALTGVAKSVIRGIQRRAITNKLILWLTVLVLLAANITVLYYWYLQ